MTAEQTVRRNQAEQALATLVAKKDPTIFQDPETFGAHLERQSGLSGPEVTSLKAGLAERLPWVLRQSGQAPPAEADVRRIRATLMGTHGLSEVDAAWALDVWARVLGVSLPKVPIVKVDSAPPPAAHISLGIEFGKDVRGNLRIRKVWTPSEPLPAGQVELTRPLTPHVRRFPLPEGAGQPAPSSALSPGSSSAVPPAPSSTGKQHGSSRPSRKPAAPAPDARAGAAPPPLPPQDSGKNAVRPPATGRGSGTGQRGGQAPSRPASAKSRLNTPPARQMGPSAPEVPAGAPRVPPTTPVGMVQEGLRVLATSSSPGAFREARRWFEAAAKTGLAAAQFQLGMMSLRGHGVAEDVVTARKWFQAAAAKGDPDAQVQLGILYQCGYGVDLNLAEARRWFESAARQGHPEAKQCLEQLAEVM